MKTIIALLMLTTAATFAADGRFLNLIAGFSVPMGDYALQTDDPNAGFAKIGFAGGLEYDWFIKRSHWAWSTAFHYIANDYESGTFTRGVDLDLYESGTYSTLTLLTGVKWQKNLVENIAFFSAAHVGYASTKGPFLSGYPSGSSDLIEFQMNSSGGFAYDLAAGLLFNQQTYLAVRYTDTGVASFAKDVSLAGRKRRVEWSTPVSMIMITVGYSIAFDD